MIASLTVNDDWYLLRASGFVALGLLTVATCLGVANLARVGRKASTRAVASLIHRNASLLAVVFVIIHVATAIADKYAGVSFVSIFVPDTSTYDPFWISLGAVSTDLLVAISVTSLLRTRLKASVWRVIHWTAYASWPTAFLHSVGSGTGAGIDTGKTWSSLVYVVTGLAFVVAVAARVLVGRKPRLSPLPSHARRRRVTAGRG